MTRLKDRSLRLLAAGYLTLDAIVRSHSEGDYWHAAGGTTGNVSVFTVALGIEATVLARVGQDRRGLHLIEFLSKAGVDTSHVERVSRMRTPGIIEVIRGTSDGAHQFTYLCPACQTRLPKDAIVSRRCADAVVQTIDQFDAFFFDRATSATIRLAKAAREAGLLVMFEPPSVPRTANAECAAALSNIVKISLKPGQYPGKWQPPEEAHTQFIVETLGAQGVRIRSKRADEWDMLRECPAIQQEVIRDTAGAGDWLTAGLLCSLLQSGDAIGAEQLDASIEYGQRLSAISLAFDGPQGALTALGAKAMKRMADSPGPFAIASETISHTTIESNYTRRHLDHCGLCLTAMPQRNG